MSVFYNKIIQYNCTKTGRHIRSDFADQRNLSKQEYVGSDKLTCLEESPRECPERSNTTERTTASSRPDSIGASWNISKMRSSVLELTCQRATAKPGLSAGINCDGSVLAMDKWYLSGIYYAHDQRRTPVLASK
jgi:hypothetical protein